MRMSFPRSEQLNRLALRPNERIYAGPAIATQAPDATAEAVSVDRAVATGQAPGTRESEAHLVPLD
jgi:hypothetical protein